MGGHKSDAGDRKGLGQGLDRDITDVCNTRPERTKRGSRKKGDDDGFPTSCRSMAATAKPGMLVGGKVAEDVRPSPPRPLPPSPLPQTREARQPTRGQEPGDHRADCRWIRRVKSARCSLEPGNTATAEGGVVFAHLKRKQDDNDDRTDRPPRWQQPWPIVSKQIGAWWRRRCPITASDPETRPVPACGFGPWHLELGRCLVCSHTHSHTHTHAAAHSAELHGSLGGNEIASPRASVSSTELSRTPAFSGSLTEHGRSGHLRLLCTPLLPRVTINHRPLH